MDIEKHKTAFLRTFGDRLRERADAVVKAALSGTAVLLGIGIIIFVVFSVVPSALGDAETILESDIAAEMYDQTMQTPFSLTSPATEAQDVFEQPEPEATTAMFARDEFAAVLFDNADIVGRISVPPDIKYLVTQSSDNEYYLEHGYENEKTKYGAIFLDYRCSIDVPELSGHYILYGHHMKDGSMFAPLMSYKDEAYFMNNRVIRFDTLYADYEWEVFSAYVTDTDFYFIETIFPSDADWLDFLHTIQDKSAFETDSVLTADDVVLTLSTCTYEFDDARFVVHSRLIR